MGAKVQVTGTAERLQRLAPYFAASQECLLVGTLHVRTETSARGVERLCVDVRLDGQPIGALSATTAKNTAPLVQHLNAQGLTAAGWLEAKGSSIAAEVGLHATKATDIEESWLLGPPVTLPAFVVVA